MFVISRYGFTGESLGIGFPWAGRRGRNQQRNPLEGMPAEVSPAIVRRNSNGAAGGSVAEQGEFIDRPVKSLGVRLVSQITGDDFDDLRMAGAELRLLESTRLKSPEGFRWGNEGRLPYRNRLDQVIFHLVQSAVGAVCAQKRSALSGGGICGCGEGVDAIALIGKYRLSRDRNSQLGQKLFDGLPVGLSPGASPR